MIVSTKRPLKDTEYRIQELELTKDGGLLLETLTRNMPIRLRLPWTVKKWIGLRQNCTERKKDRE